MKRKGNRRRRSVINTNLVETSVSDFLSTCSIIEYNADAATESKVEHIKSINLNGKSNCIQWLDCFDTKYYQFHKEIIFQNKLDDFLVVLLDTTTQRNKLVELDNCFFISTQSISEVNTNNLQLETINFIVAPNFIWSIQEFAGDPFDNIRHRLLANQGVARQKKVDYLLFIIMEAIIDSYFSVYEELSKKLNDFVELELNGKKNHSLSDIEMQRKVFYQLKKAVQGLRESISHINTIDLPIFANFNDKYFIELKEQTNSLLDSIESELQRIESATNLLFSLQNSRMNEIMKTLTVITVLIIPLNFITGLYGMNFDNIPGLHSNIGFFLAIGMMATSVLAVLYYFKRKKWF